ncbi:MAG TPA: hypothetical protein P5534_00600 [Candidatus Paceibacterota bacterium]|nr:hypothetical protein [Candidatus Paceibacterota bacterium]
MKTLIRFATLGLVALALPVLAQQPSAAERAAMLKATMTASQAVLKQYEWVETTVISLKGEEESRQMNRCYYGADGGVQKVPLTTPLPAKKKRGLRGKIAEAKQEELTDYMKEAVALVKSYVPPTPVLIQAAKDAGKVSLDVLEPGRRARLNFRDYLKPGDNLGVEVDLTSNRLLALTVKTYLDSAKDVVDLQAGMGTLADGTSYADAITLNAPAKKLTVKVDNSGYRKTN